jgi:G protein-coupled receptor GPR1
MSAGLAFVNAQGGYRLQGPYCLLPIRPFWYRLALAWIPRYIIILIIISLAIAIYTYVGWEFKSYNAVSKKLVYTMQDELTATTLNINACQTKSSLFGDDYVPSEGLATRPASSMTHQKFFGLHSRRASATSQEGVSIAGRRSSVSFACNELCGASGPTSILAASTSPTSESFARSTRRLHSNHSGPARPPLVSIPSGQTVRRLEYNDSLRPPLSSSLTDTPSATPVLHSFPRDGSTPELALLEPPSPGLNHMIRQRGRIHRQLRLMFIYPIVYTLMWVAPFVYHCMMYNDYYARNPVWEARLANSVCIASMGLVNGLVFSLQEKPWRSIATSDGTLLGSFFVWNGRNERRTGRLRGRSKSAGAGGAPPKGELAQRSLSDGGLYGPRRSIGSSAGFYGYSRAEKNWARERLEWEREERYRMLRERAMRGRVSSIWTHSVCESSCYGDTGDYLEQGDDMGEEMTDRSSGKRPGDVESRSIEGKGNDTT